MGVTTQWRTLALALLLLNLYTGLSASYLLALEWVLSTALLRQTRIGADINSIISQLRPERHSRLLGREIASVREAARSLPTFVGSGVEVDGRIAGVRRGGLLRCLMSGLLRVDLICGLVHSSFTLVVQIDRLRLEVLDLALRPQRKLSQYFFNLWVHMFHSEGDCDLSSGDNVRASARLVFAGIAAKFLRR